MGNTLYIANTTMLILRVGRYVDCMSDKASSLLERLLIYNCPLEVYGQPLSFKHKAFIYNVFS